MKKTTLPVITAKLRHAKAADLCLSFTARLRDVRPIGAKELTKSAVGADSR